MYRIFEEKRKKELADRDAAVSAQGEMREIPLIKNPNPSVSSNSGVGTSSAPKPSN